MKLIKSPWLTLYLSLLTSLCALASWYFLPAEAMINLVRENGPVENLTLVVYIVAIAAILYGGKGFLTIRTRAACTIVLTYMFMREADMHKSLNGMSILKIKFWLSGQIPVADKLLAVAILVPVLWALIYFLKNYTRQWLNDLFRKEGYAIGIFMFLAVLVISKIFDRSLNMMTEMWGWHFPLWLEALVTGQEEYLECILPLLVMVSFFQYRETHGSVWTSSGSPYIAFYLAILASLSALICWWVLPPHDMLVFVEENGMVETLTLVAYAIAVLVVVFGGGDVKPVTRCALVVMLVYMFMREADWHKSVSSESILKSKFWLGSQIPVTDKLLAALILLPVVWMLIYFIWNYTRSFFRSLGERQGYAISILVFLVVLVVSKMIDRSLNVLTELYQMQFPDWTVAFQVSQEEFLECLLPVLIVVAFFQYKRSRRGLMWS